MIQPDASKTRSSLNSALHIWNQIGVSFILRMALELGGIEEKDYEDRRKSSDSGPERKTEEEEDADEDEDENEDEDEEDEPRLKYTSLTKNLRLLYRNGDATSAFLVAGDKMVRFMSTAAGAYSSLAEAS